MKCVWAYMCLVAVSGVVRAEVAVVVGDGVVPGLTRMSDMSAVCTERGADPVFSGGGWFYADRMPTSGVATVRIRFVPRMISGASAALRIGNAELNFCGKDGRLHVSGYPLSVRKPLRRTLPTLKDGQESEVVCRFGGDILDIFFDDEKTVSVPWKGVEKGPIGINPRRAEIRVKSFEIEADEIVSCKDRLKTESEEVNIAKNFPVKDYSGSLADQTVIAQGTPDVYQGHPTTVMLGDRKTVLAVWTIGHGGNAGPCALSSDCGKSWTRIDERFPDAFRSHVNCPSAYRLIGPDGKARIWIWSQKKIPDGQRVTHSRGKVIGFMPSVMSEDEGITWREMPPLGEKFSCVMTFASVARLKNGAYMGFFHRDAVSEGGVKTLEVVTSVTDDGGFTWSDPVAVARVDGKDLCEPCAFRSQDGSELCCVMRENSRSGRSMVMFSENEGRSWTDPVYTPWSLTGDRHQAVLLANGRIVTVFRDTALNSATRGDFVAWVGTYDDIKSGKDGKDCIRIRLLKNHAGLDCGYSGINVCENGTLLAVTYLKYRDDGNRHSLVAVRFRAD